MGRPLKIKKSTTVDIGFPNFGSLTNSTYPVTLTADNYLGVVGGAAAGVATAAYPVLSCQVNISGSGAGVEDGYIVRQKGSSKYLVTGITSGATGQCLLSNSAAPAAGYMSIGMSINGDSTQIYISRLTNKWALDYANNRYVINFFTDEGTEIKSGTANDEIGLAQAESYTS